MIVRSRNAVFIFLCLGPLVILLWQFLRLHAPPPGQPGQAPKLSSAHPAETGSPGRHNVSCSRRFNLPNELKIAYPVNYGRRKIIVRPKAGLERKSVTKVEAPLFPDMELVDRAGNSDPEMSTCTEPLVLEVPQWETLPADASHIIFGTSTLLTRLEASIPYFQRWLAYTNARLFVIVVGPKGVPPDSVEMKRLENRLRDVGVSATLIKPLENKHEFDQRYFSLIKVLYGNRDSKTKWVSFIDDDTFFTSMPIVVSALAKFDFSKQYYIGALSEQLWTVGKYGLMGMGGAGIFLSLPMAAVVNAKYDHCISETKANAGDIRIFECVTWNSNTPLTPLPGLYQIDIHGDRSGLFESGRKIISLHHWKEGWWDVNSVGGNKRKHETWFPMDRMHLVADICGTCFLQRWQFGTDSVLSNGYSIAVYPKGSLTEFEDHHGLDKVEQTWPDPKQIQDAAIGPFDHYLGPLRPMLKLEVEKLQYRFLHAETVGGGVRQFYLHLGLGGEADTLVELLWIREEKLNYDDT